MLLGQPPPHNIDRIDRNKDRWKSVDKAIERARELRAEGKADDAERIFKGLERLYGNDPAAKDKLKRMRD